MRYGILVLVLISALQSAACSVQIRLINHYNLKNISERISVYTSDCYMIEINENKFNLIAIIILFIEIRIDLFVYLYTL